MGLVESQFNNQEKVDETTHQIVIESVGGFDSRTQAGYSINQLPRDLSCDYATINVIIRPEIT